MSARAGRRAALGGCLFAAAAAAAAGGCSGREREARFAEAAALTGGDPARGPALIRHYGCGSCHTIPGIVGADGLVGPPLDGIASRAYIAGRLPNTPENLVAWLQTPQRYEPGGAMPDLGVTEPDARRMAAYLYTLR